MFDIGSVLKAAREGNKLSQREFAERLGVDQSKVSRIESGGVVLSPDELENWLSVFREDDVKRVKLYLYTPWDALEEPKPSWNHPDLEALSMAAYCAKRLQTEQLPTSLSPSVQRFLRDIQHAAVNLRSLKYRASLVGATAVGKSTAEAYGFNLKTPKGEPVLPTGGGSTTLCEVVVEQGQDWGLMVEPESSEEVIRLTDELCKSIRPVRSGEERLSVPSEVRTALLNMADLASKDVTVNGQLVRKDPLRELAEQEGDRVLSRVLLAMRLAERTVTEMWWEPGVVSDPLSWLRENLRKVNRGLLSNVPLPKRVRVIIPRPVLPNSPYNLTLVDTRGITNNVVRRNDLVECLSGERTVTILCSGFLNAPDAYVRNVIAYADEQELINWRTRIAVLLLARPGDPDQVRYEDTDELVDSPEDGIRIKEEHTRHQLHELNASDVAIHTYNAFNDSPDRFHTAIVNRIEAMRETERKKITTISRSVEDMIRNSAELATQAARNAVCRDMLLMLKSIQSLSSDTVKPQEYVMRQIAAAHPRTVWAMTRRRGIWHLLSLDLHLSDAASETARRRVNDSFLKITGLLDMLATRDDIAGAESLIAEIRKVVAEARYGFVAWSRYAVTVTIWKNLHNDLSLWDKCQEEWIWGSGFRDRVLVKLANWFNDNQQSIDEFEDNIGNVWQERFLKPIEDFCTASQQSD